MLLDLTIQYGHRRPTLNHETDDITLKLSYWEKLLHVKHKITLNHLLILEFCLLKKD